MRSFLIFSLLTILGFLFLITLHYYPEINSFIFDTSIVAEYNKFIKKIESKINLNLYKKRVVFYKKRYWCSKDNHFRYYKEINVDAANHRSSDVKNYYQLVYLTLNNTSKENSTSTELDASSKEFLYLESSYKNNHYPVGTWIYYDEKGQIFKKEIYDNSHLAFKILYTYNEDNGKIYQESEYEYRYLKDNEPSLIVNTLYFYNFSLLGIKFLTQKEYYKYGILTTVEKYKYNEFAQLKETSNFKLNKYEYTIQYSYDSLGNIIQEDFYNENGKIYQSKRFFYKKDNLFSRKEIWTSSESGKNLKIYRIYDFAYNQFSLVEEEVLYEKDNFTEFKFRNTNKEMDKKIYKDFIKNGLKRIYKIKYSYNKDACKIEEKRFDAKNDLIEKIVY